MKRRLIGIALFTDNAQPFVLVLDVLFPQRLHPVMGDVLYVRGKAIIWITVHVTKLEMKVQVLAKWEL